VESNAVLVSPKLSKDGKPLWAAGPQVGYWSPQIFSEYELHGGGIDVEGVTFPGAAPWPLIGHGIDFAWTGTSANSDNQDTFVETLCSPDGSPPTAAVPFMRLAENSVTDYRSFFHAFSPFPGTENWFYVDDKNVGFMQSGVYPKHAVGSNVDLPFNGDGTGDWQGFNPDGYTFKSISLGQRPKAVD